MSSATVKCPFCGASPVVNETCPGSCGSLEGVPCGEAPRKSRVFGFDWANGFVAPFLAINTQAALAALQAANVSSEDFLVDLGCGDGRICRVAASELGAKMAVG